MTDKILVLMGAGLVIALTSVGWGVLLLEYDYDRMTATLVSIGVILIGAVCMGIAMQKTFHDLDERKVKSVE